MKKKGLEEDIWVYSGRINVSVITVFTLFCSRWRNNEKRYSNFDSNQHLKQIIGRFCTEYLFEYFLHMSFLIWGGERYFISMIRQLHSNYGKCAWGKTVKYSCSHHS